MIRGLGQYDITHPRPTPALPADNVCPYLLLDVRDRDDYELCHIVTGRLLLLSLAFHDLKFCLSNQLKAASSARCSSEMPPSKQVSLFGVHRSRRVARRCNPTHACCCGMVPRLFGTCLAGSSGHGQVHSR